MDIQTPKGSDRLCCDNYGRVYGAWWRRSVGEFGIVFRDLWRLTIRQFMFCPVRQERTIVAFSPPLEMANVTLDPCPPTLLPWRRPTPPTKRNRSRQGMADEFLTPALLTAQGADVDRRW